MLALLGLLGAALAGTAFVALGGAETDVEEPTVQDLEDDLTDGDMLDIVELEAPAGGQWATNPEDDIVGAYGSADADTMEGASNHDYLNGRDGDDTLTGQDGDDQLLGGDGDDALIGGHGADLLNGHVGNDAIDGGAGNDRLQGGDGNDHLDGHEDDDDLLGGWGDDTLVGGAGSDNLQGSEGNDVVDGVTGETVAERDYLNGSEGNDRLIGNNGDVMTGGDDADIFEIASGSVQVMDYTDEDIVVVHYTGDMPSLTTETTDTGTSLMADGVLIADFVGLTSFDVSSVQMEQAYTAP